MNDKLEFPLFDGKETLTQFMRRVNDFDLRNKKPKYDIILEFVNVLTNSKYTSLTEFMNVPNSKIINNKKIMDQYSTKLSKILNIDILELTKITTSEDEEQEQEIIIFLKKILSSIEYSLVSKNIDNKIIYSIKNKSALGSNSSTATHRYTY